MAEVQIGIAGWSYADRQELVYPTGCAEPLKWIAGHVQVVEINTSFYRASVPEGMLDRDPELGAVAERRQRRLL